MNFQDLKQINKTLKTRYGVGLDGRPRWRLVENLESYTEKRYGIFGKFDIHNNYLGEETCVRSVPKYSYIPYGIYILEQLYHADVMPMEIQLANISNNEYYEIRWPFMNNEMEYLEPCFEGCEFIIKCIQTINKKSKTTQKDREEVNKKKTIEMLSEGDPAFIGPMVFKDSTKVFEQEKKQSETVSSQA